MDNETPVWLITGCSIGLGRDMARAVLRHGRRLVATARRPETLAEFADRDDVLVVALVKPFVRLEDSRSAETGGLGLGLAIVKNIAHAHGGDLVLENAAGGGLRAELRLP